ncbi:MAG: hypothetical protein HY541_05765 [Deltaproteobacteria bacterium]|nr:hypothetical protein [Deltaproteobacteria bacterium]
MKQPGLKFFIPYARWLRGRALLGQNPVVCHGILGPGLALGFIPLILLLMLILTACPTQDSGTTDSSSDEAVPENSDGGTSNDSEDTEGQDGINPTDETPTNESPTDEAPADESPIDEPPTDGGDTTVTVPTTADQWTEVYNGYGSVGFDAVEGIVMEPQIPVGNDTHSALVLAKITETCPVKDFRLTIEATTIDQLRPENPNPWEVFWIFFNYLPDGAAKTTNYFILKTNGIELGRAYEETAQEFLYTVPEPQLMVGTSNIFVLEKSGGNLTVSIDGSEALNYQSGDWPGGLYDQAGAIGLYTEDARVRIHTVTIESDDLACNPD